MCALVNVNTHIYIINHNAHAQLQTNFSLCSTKSGREGKPIYLNKNKERSSLKNMIFSIKEQLLRVTLNHQQTQAKAGQYSLTPTTPLMALMFTKYL